MPGYYDNSKLVSALKVSEVPAPNNTWVYWLIGGTIVIGAVVLIYEFRSQGYYFTKQNSEAFQNSSFNKITI